MLVIGSTYEAPWDINPWCEENLAALEKLDKHNLSLRRVSDPSLLAFGQWAELCDDVEHLVESSEPAQPLLVYINLHGVLSQEGQPFLLVNDSQPLDDSTWLSLDALIQRIRQAMLRPRPLVVAIEGGRQNALPLPVDREQTFADGVRKWYASLQQSGQAQGLSIIVSSTSRFGSVEHTGVAGDLFTHCLAEALCGRCDQAIYGGNADQRIEFDELQRYVHDQVEQRSHLLRIVPQLTECFTSTEGARFLAWNTALDTQSLMDAELVEPFPTALEALTATWKQIYTLQPHQPWHEEPQAWGMLKRTMVAWEQAIFGGNDARSRAAQFEQSAKILLSQIGSRISQRDRNAGLEAKLCSQSVKLWQKLAESPSLVVAKQLAITDAQSKLEDPMCAVPLLIELLEQPGLSIWSQPERLRQVALIEVQIEQSRSMQTGLPSIHELIDLENHVDGQRRQLEDRICADADEGTWDRRIAELESLVRSWQAQLEQVHSAVEFNEKMLARLPAVYRVVDRLDNQTHQAQETHKAQETHGAQQSGSLSNQVDLIEQTMWLNRNRLAAALCQDAVPLDLTVANQHAQEFFTQLAQQWQRTLSEASNHLPCSAMTLESLLASGLLPVEIGSIDKAVQLRLSTHKRLSELDWQNARNSSPEMKLDFGVRNENRLARWLDLPREHRSPEHRSDSAGAAEPERLWLDMQTARACACFGLGASSTEAFSSWQNLQIRTRQLQASARVLNDFWKLPALDGQDYYAAMAGKLMSDVQAQYRSELESLLQERASAAKHGLKLDCQCSPAWNAQTQRMTACRLTQATATLPVGLAALQVIELDSKKRVSPVVSFETATLDQSPVHRLPIQLADSFATRGPAVALVTFRGHRFQSAFDLCPLVGSATVGTTASNSAASINVQSIARKQRARMLVLDCSASMHQPQTAEGAFDAATPSQVPTRLDAARLAFHSILDHWRGQPDHVGVILYGHRVALGTKEQGRLLQTRYLARYPLAGDIQAYEDVETILPPGRFHDQEFSEVQQRLQAVVPWGQTPLYLAVLQATEELARYHHANAASTQTKSDLDVIVVSDGRNYQFNPTADKNITLDQVIQEAKQLGVRVHVIGFGIAPNELEQATNEFTQLAQQTGGSVCMEVQTAMQLVNHIDGLTEPESFRVRLLDGRWVDSRCGEPVGIPSVVENNTPILVDYRNTSTLIPTSPGAAMRLSPGPANRLVRAQPLFQSAVRTSISTPEGHVSPFEVVIHIPNSQLQRTQWLLGLERSDALVAQRPKYVWTELQPKFSNTKSEASTYVLCDPVWQTETTQPVLGFETHDWPDGADSGLVQFWCSDQLPEPITTFRCDPSKLVNSWQAIESQLSVGRVQYQLQAEAGGITLVLLHGQPSEVLELMPQIEQLPGGTTVERRYCPSQRISIHRFTHASLPKQAAIQVAIYSVSGFKAHALRSTTAIEVRLPKNVASVPAGEDSIFR